MLRQCLGFVFGLLLAASVLAVEAHPLVLDEDGIEADYRAGVYTASLSLRVAVAPSIALDALTDFEHMPDFVANLTGSRIVSRNGNVFHIAQQGKATFGPFAFPFESVRRVEVLPDGRILARALSGSSKHMRSELRYQADGGGTRIDYRLEVVPDRWVPSSVGVAFLRHELAEQFSGLAYEMVCRQKSRQK